MRLQLPHKLVQAVVPLLLAPLQHLRLRPLDLLLCDPIQVPFYFSPQNRIQETVCGLSIEYFPKAFPTLSVIVALLAEVVGQLSDCHWPHYAVQTAEVSSHQDFMKVNVAHQNHLI